MNLSLVRIAELVQAESGVRALQPHAIARALAVAAPGLDADAFLAAVAGKPELLSRLIDEATVQETFFWRDEAQLATIDWRSLLDRARARGANEIQAWTAGCSSGDETYTLALQAMHALGASAPPVRILGTDLSRTALDRAAAGVYRERSLRLVPRRRRLSAFEPAANGCARIRESACSLVRFARHNLVRDPVPPPGSFDLVLCRNVLIYFDAETASLVYERLRSALALGGRLLLGAADRLCITGAETPAPAPARRPAPPRQPAHAEPTPLFTAGIAHLVRGNAVEAIATFRRALYIEPLHAAAAFQLGRAHEANGDADAARRAYGQALRALSEAPVVNRLPAQVSAADVAAACTCRIEALS